MTTHKNNQKQAVALRYDQMKDTAPKVTASGRGYTAETMIQKAKDNNIPIQEDHSFVELLGELSINETIPEELYQATAEVFAYIFQIDRHLKQ
ncbi:EscU/YscU/HrcU family type III secretion system export apparatus switch protein [Aquibacillus sp. 3ASR75-11]|uniref:EscU/YscU/HrcU family type III secretion system export apparatus switch protein n=1 Tax=Terrihalobacillus insolitus TaxID=2950438 RepID=A0A9X4AMK7_9BACI|nr:EscU/YscU/HrcU family type III secretion system export apparatus switch protein [Terrihalobacillus insolitus]MDC3414151.1 EscU/YscU/HrcU family type III secretion system export apparatus switch protein [Terrihalobacillus insolitus]MDC3423593.1 EscU/YscU/HrcU family type III secretion system export apparatus switch protein [Terrihalobacillus insolitus]